VTFTKVAVVGFLALVGFVCWLAAAGFGAAREGLICLLVLVLLVGGGNLLSGRSGPHGRRGGSALRDNAAPGPGDGADTARRDESTP
jgi:hypothetical protein